MAKKPPHKRKKQSVKKSPTKANKIETPEVIEEQIEFNQQERSWTTMLIMALVLFMVLGFALIFLYNRDNNTPTTTPLQSASAGGTGITIEGGSLGQISNTATSGIQSNANPLGGSATPSNPSSASQGQTNNLQSTSDKCAYQQFDQSLQNTCLSQ